MKGNVIKRLEDVRLYLDAIEQEAKAFFEGRGE